MKKVGHCGTLDPIATGLLLLTLGRGTKIQDLLMSEDKEYAGTMHARRHDRQPGSRLAVTLEERPVPPLDEADRARRVREIFAAISTRCRRWFQRSSKVACRFTNSRARARPSNASRGWCTSIATQIERIASPEIDFSVVCSKGFYVRTYAHDIGETLGCGAHLKDLRRTKSGRFSVEGAITVEELQTSEPVDILGRILTLPEVSRMRGA